MICDAKERCGVCLFLDKLKYETKHGFCIVHKVKKRYSHWICKRYETTLELMKEAGE